MDVRVGQWSEVGSRSRTWHWLEDLAEVHVLALSRTSSILLHEVPSVE
jgi:hypothetical protein